MKTNVKNNLQIAAIALSGLFVFSCATQEKTSPGSYEKWQQTQTNKAEAMQDSMMQAAEKVYAK